MAKIRNISDAHYRVFEKERIKRKVKKVPTDEDDSRERPMTENEFMGILLGKIPDIDTKLVEYKKQAHDAINDSGKKHAKLEGKLKKCKAELEKCKATAKDLAEEISRLVGITTEKDDTIKELGDKLELYGQQILDLEVVAQERADEIKELTKDMAKPLVSFEEKEVLEQVIEESSLAEAEKLLEEEAEDGEH